jgi:hypothetical protein
VQDFSINVLLAQVFTAEVAKVHSGFIDYRAFGTVINNMLFSAYLCDLCGKNIFVLDMLCSEAILFATKTTYGLLAHSR